MKKYERKARKKREREREEREKKGKGEIQRELGEFLRALTIKFFSYLSIEHASA